MSLGDLQQLTMLAVARLGDDAYGASVREEILRVAGRRVAVQTIYVTLVRLEERGLLHSAEVPREEGEGGRARRVFRLTKEGGRALDDSRREMTSMWSGVSLP